MGIGLEIGGAFFLAMLGTAIGHDVKRNWGRPERTVDWNPLLFWKLLLYAGSLMLLILTFLAYRQRWSLSLGFGTFAFLCWFAARSLAVTVRVPTKPTKVEAQRTDSVTPGSHTKHWAGGHLHPGFVAMEYFALILNRSFLIFITAEGLRVWNFHGMVSSLQPLFYESVEALLDDPDMTAGSQAFEELMQRRHTFSVRYSEIRSVEFVDRQKWGMGSIPHSGRLLVEFSARRRKREFILLGSAHGQLIRDMIASRIQRH